MKTKEILAEKGTRVITVEETVLLVDAVTMFSVNQIGCIIVVNSRNEAIGLVAPIDVFKAIQHHPEYLSVVTVSEIMTRDIIVVTPEDDVDDLMTIMTKNRIRHLPVIDRGQLAGLISIGDLVKAKITNWDVEIHYLTDYIGGKVAG